MTAYFLSPAFSTLVLWYVELRVLLGVEEVGRLEVRVALRLARVDARGVDLDLHRRLGRVGRVEGELGGPFGEVAA